MAAHFVRPGGCFYIAEAHPFARSSTTIVTSLAAAGLCIEYLHEFPWIAWPMDPYLVETEPRTWRLPEPFDGKLPLMFSLKATKP